MLFAVTAMSQHRYLHQSARLKEFSRLLNEVNASFMFPPGFRETKVVNNEDFSFDYAIELPDKDFEIWFQLKSLKQNWVAYLNAKNSQDRQQANPDSLYLEIGHAQATAFSGDQEFTVRNLSPEVLARYGADAGKTYLITIMDMPETKHYKYALLITLQKNHTGTIVAVCFTNEKNAEFFKNMRQAANCVKFKADRSTPPSR